MDKGAWQAKAHVIAKRVRHDLATKQQGAQCTLSFILGAYPVGLDKWHVPILVSNKVF